MQYFSQIDVHSNWIHNHDYCKIKIVNKYNTCSVLRKIFNIDVADIIENKLQEYNNVIFIDYDKKMEFDLFEHNGPSYYMNNAFCGKIYNSTKFKINANNWPNRVANLI